MRYGPIAVLIVSILVPSFAVAAVPRPVDAWSSHAFTLARQRSALVRAMVSELAASNVIVHIQSSRVLPAGVGGITRFVASQGGYRYLRITLSISLPPPDRVAILGHELQHALELARSTAVDTPGLRRFFAREGAFAVRGDDFLETREAVWVEKRIRQELKSATDRASSSALP